MLLSLEGCFSFSMPALIPSVRSQATRHGKSSDILFGVMLRSVQAKRKSQRTCRQFEHALSFFSFLSGPEEGHRLSRVINGRLASLTAFIYERYLSGLIA